MKKILGLMLALGLLVAACGGTDDEPAGGTNTTARATTFVSRTDLFEQPGSVFVPSTSSHPLVLRAIDFDAGMVEIANTGSEAFDLAGHWLCGQFNYEPLAETIAPGASLMVSLDGLEIEASDGELGLYTTTRSFSSADAIIRYVEWGSSGHGRSGVAVIAGVWTDGDFVSGGGANLSSSGDDPIAARDWTSG